MRLVLARRARPALAGVVLALSLAPPAASAPDGTGDEEVGVSPPPPEATVPVSTGPAAVSAAAPEQSLRARAEVFSRFRDPFLGKAGAIGSYSNGCLVGGVALPRTGSGFEVIRLGRNRRFGHPSLVAYIKRLAGVARKQKLGTLMVGDVAQPRGGPTPNGHRSHQSGLDVDIGFTGPSWLGQRPLKDSEREHLSLVPVMDLSTRTFTPDWSRKVERLIAAAASDPDVERVFVNPRIKRELCDRATKATMLAIGKGRGARGLRPQKVSAARKSEREDWSWLRTVRPWWGHHDHMHVRLKCPADSPGCEAQGALPLGDGCNEIAWWETEEARRTREPRRDPNLAPVEPRLPPPFPAACQALLEKVPDERGGGGLRTTAQRHGR